MGVAEPERVVNQRHTLDAETITEDQIRALYQRDLISLDCCVAAIQGLQISREFAARAWATLRTCPHCNERPRTGAGDYSGPTCGASECQEAEYNANRARGKRPRRRRS